MRQLVYLHALAQGMLKPAHCIIVEASLHPTLQFPIHPHPVLQLAAPSWPAIAHCTWHMMHTFLSPVYDSEPVKARAK